MDFFISAAQAQAAGASGGQGIVAFLPLVMIIVVFYLFLVRPQNKRAKIAVGDEVATAGGLLGKVVEVGDQYLTLEIASGVNVKLQKVQVSQLLPKGTVKGA
jgi:preprotein translocase subunit YajC